MAGVCTCALYKGSEVHVPTEHVPNLPGARWKTPNPHMHMGNQSPGVGPELWEVLCSREERKARGLAVDRAPGA